MKTCRWIIVALWTVALSSLGNAQITNLMVNGSGTSFTMASGDTITWSYDIPAGKTALCEIWYDVNHNGIIEPATDRQYISFSQTDGDTSGNGGPPDLDGAANGHVFFSFRVGLSPGNFIMKFSNNGSSASVLGTITPLASPAHTISGHVTAPAGKSPRYIFMDMESRGSGGMNIFWDAMTDSLGNYAIKMDADTSGNPWRIRLQSNPFPPAILSPEDTMLVITGNHSGYNFTFHAAAAQVAGYLLHDDGSPAVNTGAYVMRVDTNYFSRRTNPGSDGFFQIGLLPGDLTGKPWILQSETNGPYNMTTTEMQAYVEIPAITTGDSLFRMLKIYSTNATIRGTVFLNGAPPGFSMQVTAVNPDTAIAYTNSDSSTGNFSVPVSNMVHTYWMRLGWIPPDWAVDVVTAHAGDNNVVINVRTASWGSVAHRPGWNMLALPLIPGDAHKNTLFPSATTAAYNFVSGSGYKTDTVLQLGKGYWMKFTDSTSDFMYGYTYYRDTLNVLAGWNMIATPSPGIPTAAIIAVGTTVLTPYYGYSGGYFTTGSLGSGIGYWVKVNQAGQLIVNTNAISPLSAAKIPGGTAVPDAAEGLRKLTVTDAAGEQRSIYFTPHPPDHPLSWYDLPPLPPAGIMDVRYATQRNVEHASAEPGVKDAIVISSASYPVRISWQSLSHDNPATLTVDGKKIAVAGTGEAVIRSEQSIVQIELGASPAREIPSQFALRQNFPNPFNPSTIFSYDLAAPAQVRLTLFNTLGQEVAQIVDEFQAAGSYHLTYAPANLPSGVYFYRLTAGEFTAMRKMILIK